MEINLSLILIYFVVWLNSAQKQTFADKIFVVERESRKVWYNKY